MKKTAYTIIQDGHNFYVDDPKIGLLATYPGHFQNGDLRCSEMARAWFVNIWCWENDVDPIFEESE